MQHHDRPHLSGDTPPHTNEPDATPPNDVDHGTPLQGTPSADTITPHHASPTHIAPPHAAPTRADDRDAAFPDRAHVELIAYLRALPPPSMTLAERRALHDYLKAHLGLLPHTTVTERTSRRSHRFRDVFRNPALWYRRPTAPAIAAVALVVIVGYGAITTSPAVPPPTASPTSDSAETLDVNASTNDLAGTVPTTPLSKSGSIDPVTRITASVPASQPPEATAPAGDVAAPGEDPSLDELLAWASSGASGYPTVVLFYADSCAGCSPIPDLADAVYTARSTPSHILVARIVESQDTQSSATNDTTLPATDSAPERVWHGDVTSDLAPAMAPTAVIFDDRGQQILTLQGPAITEEAILAALETMQP